MDDLREQVSAWVAVFARRVGPGGLLGRAGEREESRAALARSEHERRNLEMVVENYEIVIKESQRLREQERTSGMLLSAEDCLLVYHALADRSHRLRQHEQAGREEACVGERAPSPDERTRIEALLQRIRTQLPNLDPANRPRHT